MAPHAYPIVNGSLNIDPYHPYSLTSSPSSSSSETITNTVFGLCAVAIGMVSIWQGRRAWKIWHVNCESSSTAQNPGDRATPEVALELGAPPQAPTEQAQLPSEPAPPYTAILQSSPKFGENSI